MSKQPLSLKAIADLKAEYRRLKDDENHLHNNLMHQSILRTWEQDSPAMWERLTRLGIADEMAFVAQAKMWDRSKELREAGMPMTDAREQAEREHLMLEPESQEPEDGAMAGAADLMNLLQESKEMVAKFRQRQK